MLTPVEQDAVDDFRSGALPKTLHERTAEERAIYAGIRLILEAGKVIRAHRSDHQRLEVVVKEDGSPATAIEEDIEELVRNWVRVLDPSARVVGEETGGVLPSSGTAIAVDPIDGTRAFLAETETFSTTLARIYDGDTVQAVISNPATGEIAHASKAGSTSRLLRLSVFGEPDAAYDLRDSGPSRVAQRPTLVNLHPSRKARSAMNFLYEAWEDGEIAMVRSPGGSPAWALVEAARGHFVYANLWSTQPAQAWDLAAGALIVRLAGGDVCDFEGNPIDPIGHRGPFIAGRDPRSLERVRDILRI